VAKARNSALPSRPILLDGTSPGFCRPTRFNRLNYNRFLTWQRFAGSAKTVRDRKFPVIED
jgi:hypothetical protein